MESIFNRREEANYRAVTGNGGSRYCSSGNQLRRTRKRALLVCDIMASLLAATILFLPGCSVKYGFSGASLSPEVKSISIQYFQNMAPLVQPGLSQYVTDELTDRVRSQTNKEMVRDLGDVDFEGEIVDYRTAPQAVSGNATASVNRFTISVRVRYTNTIEPDLSFEQTFSRFEDYDSALDLSNVEQDLTEKIIEQIIEDIFNRAFVNW